MPNLQATDAVETENGSTKVNVSGSQPASPQVAGSQNTSYNKACTFFAKGTCRNGDSCRFSHSTQPSPPATSSSRAVEITQPPPTILINLPPGHPVYSIDVECVATGVQHNARSIAQVALVDEWSRPVFSVLIKQDMPVYSYITELTGLTKEILDSHGLSLAEALALLRAHLPPNAILVGQSILKDVQWLQLAEGVDYFSLIDLSALFRVWNQERGQFTNFSQDHCAKVWIGVGERAHHNAIEDAAISMSLFNAYRMVQWDPNRLYQMQMATLSSPRIPGFSANNPVIDGCCMGNRKKCSCGGPFL
eukprot:CAMPEP_0119042992 /NCGR_PEP_ID=MMETSP1177-20130426/16325_1 /TAXON_ID=2985 /ORGANISM="Ochromonas sp, Strain CCMP1899" /LENGTH=305 /DNA_ID=CAMNT_0007010135 /DNA_START=140 /DNA_END=1057 /DNA_ORIENTATION=-